jgi:hypothetical protein
MLVPAHANPGDSLNRTTSPPLASKRQKGKRVMLHAPRESLRARLRLIVACTVLCGRWRGARDTAPQKTLLNLVPLNLRGVPAGVGRMDRRPRRRTLLTTEPVKNDLLSMLNVGVLTTGVEVLLADLNVHTQNIPLEPVKLLHLLLNERRKSLTTVGGMEHPRFPGNCRIELENECALRHKTGKNFALYCIKTKGGQVSLSMPLEFRVSRVR